MRRIIVAALGTISSLVLLFAYPTSHNATVSADGAQPASGAGGGVGSASSGSASSGTASSGAAGSSKSTSGARTYTGNAAQTRWGTVQVRITVKSGKITAAEAVRYPDDNGHSQGINSYALPVLAQEAVAAQSAQIDSVSGATVTSGGYVQSLQSAVNAAHL